MMKFRDKTYRRDLTRKYLAAAIALLTAFVMLVPAVPVSADTAEPLNQVHKVKIGSKKYCLFVDHYVILTPDEVKSFADKDTEEDPTYDALTEEVLKRAGLYMKEANCTDSKHKAITYKDWLKSGGRFRLYDEDVVSMLEAAPEDGNPVKIDMDLLLYTNAPADEQPDDGYSTYKAMGPRLLFVVIATEEDAKEGEDICVEEEKPNKDEPKKEKKKTVPKNKHVNPPKEKEDPLPEFRTISMTDRSGPPVESTLKDGDPVTLEWIEPGKRDDGSKSLIDRIPGRYAGLAVIGVLAAAAIAALILKLKQSRDEDL